VGGNLRTDTRARTDKCGWTNGQTDVPEWVKTQPGRKLTLDKSCQTVKDTGKFTEWDTISR